MTLDTQRQVDAAERTLRLSWVIVVGAVIFSVLTVTPLVQRVTPDRWDWTAPILPIVVDTAVVIVVRVDAIVARLGGRPGGWPALLRWLTGLMTLALNVGNSALSGDGVGVGVHAVAPVLLIVTAEASLKWRQTITAAVVRIEDERTRERKEAEALKARERKEREDAARAEREARAAAEERERERAREERERERDDREREREHAAQLAREEREHQARLELKRLEQEAAREAAERADAARQRQEEREHAERQRERDDQKRAREQQWQQQLRESTHRPPRPTVAAAAVGTPRPTVSTPVSTPVSTGAHEAPADRKMSEADARRAVAAAVREGRSQRQVAALTGWSTGWVAARFKELGEAAA